MEVFVGNRGSFFWGRVGRTKWKIANVDVGLKLGPLGHLVRYVGPHAWRSVGGKTNFQNVFLLLKLFLGPFFTL